MPRKSTLDKWYTVTEAAQILGYSRANIWDLIKTGVFPSSTLRGRIYLINASDIKRRQDFISARKARADERARRRAAASADATAQNEQTASA